MSSATLTPTGAQFQRFASLVVTNKTDTIDLSGLRFDFEVRAAAEYKSQVLQALQKSFGQNDAKSQ